MSESKKSFFQLLDQNAERWLLLIFYVLIVMTIGVEVVRRFVLSYSSTWGEEVARYSFIYLAWIGASAAVKERAHIRIDVILSFLSRTGQLIIYILGDLVMLGVAILAVIYSFDVFQTALKFGVKTHGLGVHLAWFIAAVPIGFTLVLFRLFQSLKRDISMLRTDEPVYSGERLFD